MGSHSIMGKRVTSTGQKKAKEFIFCCQCICFLFKEESHRRSMERRCLPFKFRIRHCTQHKRGKKQLLCVENYFIFGSQILSPLWGSRMSLTVNRRLWFFLLCDLCTNCKGLRFPKFYWLIWILCKCHMSSLFNKS